MMTQNHASTLLDTLREMKQILPTEQYDQFTDSIVSLQILHKDLTHDELYSSYLNYRYFTMTVERKNRNQYAVVNPYGEVYSTSNPDTPQYENIPSERSDEFIRDTRFPLDQAIEIALSEVESLTLMGYSLDEVKQGTKQKQSE